MEMRAFLEPSFREPSMSRPSSAVQVEAPSSALQLEAHPTSDQACRLPPAPTSTSISRSSFSTCRSSLSTPPSSAAPSASNTFLVQIPETRTPGQHLSITAPDGKQVEFAVPNAIIGGSVVPVHYNPVSGGISPIAPTLLQNRGEQACTREKLMH